MITAQTKSQALARIRHNIPLEDIALEFDIPYKLVKEWADKIEGRDMIALESNVYAVEKLRFSSAEEVDPLVLQSKLENAAVELADQAYKSAGTADLVHAKSIESLAKAVTSLYTTIVLKNNSVVLNSINEASESFFSQLLKD